MATWEDFPKKHDRIAIIGFAQTRDMVPWDDKDLEIFGLNEEYNFDWIKRWDRWLQIHPKWDFMRNTNNNDPNHYLWLQGIEGECMQCKGTRKVVPLFIVDKAKVKDRSAIKCPACDGTGHYVPPMSRFEVFPIYMMKSFPEIPGSVALPLQEMSKALIPSTNWQNDYFTSSASMMLGLCYLMGYKRVEFYGFEMGADTEYHYQRSGFEYIAGIVQGKGMEVFVPRPSTLFTGPLYAYRSMKQGYRQNLEMRQRFLNRQMDEEKIELSEINGATKLLEDMLSRPDVPNKASLEADLANKKSDAEVKLGLLNGIRFSIQEVINLTKMYDNYFWTGTEEGDDGDISLPQGQVTQHITVRYKATQND